MKREESKKMFVYELNYHQANINIKFALDS